MQQEQPEKRPRVWLRQRREAFGLSRAKFAQQLGRAAGIENGGPGVKTVTRWESGESMPYPYWRPLIADVLGITREEVERLLAEHTLSDASALPSAQIWMIPYARNRSFTGRADLLERLHILFHTERPTSQIQAITGLGGIGKTMLAVEYAYRFCEYDPDYTAVLWAQAGSQDDLFSAFLTMAAALDVPEKQEQDQQVVVEAVKRWLAIHPGWLLIFDGVEDLSLLSPFLPQSTPGSRSQILLTTRCQAVGTLVASTLEMPPFDVSEGITFLQRRAKLQALDAPMEAQEQAEQRALVQELAGLPLALDQAGAYIEETGCTIAQYLEYYHTRRAWLLQRRGTLALCDVHPQSVMVTFLLALDNIEQANPVAADLLRLCAFLAPDDIPEELFLHSVPTVSPAFQSLLASPMEYEEAVALIRRYSLIQRHATARSLRMHQVVQVVIQEHLKENQQCAPWEMVAVAAVAHLFAEADQRTIIAQPYERYIPQAFASAKLIRERSLATPAAAHLLFLLGAYLTGHARYEQAEELCRAAVQLSQQHFGRFHPKTAATLANLALLYEEKRMHSRAQALFEQALAVLEQAHPSRDLERAITLGNLSRCYWSQGKFAEAERYATQALPLLERSGGLLSLPYADGLVQTATLSRDQGKLEQAQQLYEQALALYEQLLPHRHVARASCLDAAATNDRFRSNYVRAEARYREALAIFEETWGQEHPDVAGCLCRLADLCMELGKLDQVEELNQRALAIYEAIGGANYLEVNQPLQGLALLAYLQQEYTRADALYQRAIAIIEKSQGPAHPDLVSALEGYALVLIAKGALREANVLIERAEMVCQKMEQEFSSKGEAE